MIPHKVGPVLGGVLSLWAAALASSAGFAACMAAVAALLHESLTPEAQAEACMFIIDECIRPSNIT